MFWNLEKSPISLSTEKMKTKKTWALQAKIKTRAEHLEVLSLLVASKK